MLIAPTKEQDTRIELRLQNVSGSAGDKLPVTIRRLRRLQTQKEYGKTFVGVVGNTSLFTEDSLSLAREEAAKSGRVQYAEGTDTVVDALNLVFDTTTTLFKSNTPISTPALS